MQAPRQCLKQPPSTNPQDQEEKAKVWTWCLRIRAHCREWQGLLCRATRLFRVNLRPSNSNSLLFFDVRRSRFLGGEILANYPVYLSKNHLESLFGIGCFKCRSLHEWKTFLLSKALGILGGNRCFRSVLFPINITTMLMSACSLSSLSHRETFSNVVGFVTS